jgi:hypothetical protein
MTNRTSAQILAEIEPLRKELAYVAEIEKLRGVLRMAVEHQAREFNAGNCNVSSTALDAFFRAWRQEAAKALMEHPCHTEMG